MKKSIILFLLVIFPFIGFSQTQKRIALVIGNATYKYGNSLKNPVNDAELMARTLQSLGFKVTKKTNATRKDIQNAIIDFCKNLKTCDVALFYYAGHGIQVDGINYIIPVDSKIDDPLAVQFEALKVDNIVSQFEYYPNHANIVILDACRENPFLSWVRGTMNSFVPPNAPRGTIIAYATGSGSTAYDGTSTSNGVYTGILAKQMLVPQRIEDVFINTRNEVYTATKGKQQPQEWSQLSGVFYFNNKGALPNSEKNFKVEKGKVSINPAIDGQLYIDNKLIGDVKAGTNFTIDSLPQGMRKLEIKGKKYWSDSLFIAGEISDSGEDNPMFEIEDFSGKSGEFSDNETNIRYKWVRIGKQVWMAENSKRFVDDANSFCFHYDLKNLDKRGMLYTWEGAQKACPYGWHLPSKDEYLEMMDFLGNDEELGSKLKSEVKMDSSEVYWDESKGMKATNSSGFNAFATGLFDTPNSFGWTNRTSYFWTSTSYGPKNAWFLLIVDYSNKVRLNYWPVEKGFSVRCVKSK
jgi:uncharacterized protein (TIGR02145 family)